MANCTHQGRVRSPRHPESSLHYGCRLAIAKRRPVGSLPIAALHDGQQFLVEKYSIGLMPSLSLTDTRYANIKNAKVLAMGADHFTNKTQNPLPAVPVELSMITSKLWQGKSFLNEAFTLKNLKAQRTSTPYEIIHLATHAEFKSGALGNSYIQLWDTQLRLDQVRQLGWNKPAVELLAGLKQ
ncbi:CHAT domain-containing protein [Coleofasciculus sp. H7-2]|uniref:CHAT domain-containing protein n=1 Tax=Coleofasciculus sp. H7-2 TaxID=3351545 RepID=UPI00366D6ECA